MELLEKYREKIIKDKEFGTSLVNILTVIFIPIGFLTACLASYLSWWFLLPIYILLNVKFIKVSNYLFKFFNIEKQLEANIFLKIFLYLFGMVVLSILLPLVIIYGEIEKLFNVQR